MASVFELREIEPSFPLSSKADIFLGSRFHPQVARRYARHSFSLPTQHITARNVVFDPVTAMVFHEGTPMPWSCYFGPHDPRVLGDCAAAATRERNGRLQLRGRRVYCGFNRHHANYLHWTTECIPAIAGYAIEPEFVDGILLLPALNTQQWRALALAGLKLPEIAEVSADRVVAVDELVYSSLLLPHYAPSKLGRGVFDRIIRAACGPEARAGERPERRIYVWRLDASRRPMTNEDALVEYLIERGIEPIIPSTLTVDEQVRLFHEAVLVLGPHGAGLGNVVFCRPGAVLYELLPDHWTHSFLGPCINLFAQGTGMHYWADAHESHGTFAQFGHKVPWTVDLDLTLERLAQIESTYAEVHGPAL
jgi:Glycosyltransferase 61